jgi:hypothetical protein
VPALPKIDPNVKIPDAVRRLAEQADAAFRAAHPDKVDPAAAPNPEPASAPTPEPAAAPNPDVTLPGNGETINWEHRYKSMEGRNKRSEATIREMADQLANLQTVLANVQATAPAAPAPTELQAASLLSPKEVEEYGNEFLDVVGKRAKETLSPEFLAIKHDLDQLRKVVQGNTQVTAAQARRNLEVTLDEKVPNWREVNVDPEFHAWLSLPDLFSGAIRHTLLTAAYEQNNAPRVLAFFKGFLSQEAATAPALSATGEPAPADVTSGKIPLEALAAPGRAKTAAAPNAPAEKPIITTAQVSTFYADVNRGKYRGRDEEKNRLERMIVEAGRDGRIR